MFTRVLPALLTLSSILFPSYLYGQDSLVAYFPFTGSAIDSSGYDNDAKVFGAELTEDRFGYASSAYYFDGVDDYLRIEHDRIYKSATKTIEFWFMKASESNDLSPLGIFEEVLISKADNSSVHEFKLAITNELSPFNLYNAIQDNSGELVYSSKDSVIIPNKWYHVVGVIDSTSNSLYIDGQNVKTVNYDRKIGTFNSRIIVGRPGYGSITNRYFHGKIDDIKIYNYALHDSVIYKSYVKSSTPPPIEPIDLSGTITDTLIAYYQFDGNSADSSEFRNDGVSYGITPTKDRFFKPNSAIYFDGTDYIDFGPSEHIEFAKDDFSISVWVRPKFVGKSKYQILRKGPEIPTENEAQWELSLDEFGRIRIVFEDADQGDSSLVLTSENSLFENQWHHIGIIFDRDNALRVFIDGDEEISSDRIIGYPGFITNKVITNMFGGGASTVDTQDNYIGDMDDLKIFSYAINDSIIASFYTESSWPESKVEYPDTLLAHYKFTYNTLDISGYGHDSKSYGGSFVNGRSNYLGYYDKAYNFKNFNDDYLESSLSDTVLENFTVSGWYNLDSYNDSFIVGTLDSIDTTTIGWGIGVKSKRILYQHGSTIFQSDNIMSLNKWYHVAITYSDSLSHLYINGQKEKTQPSYTSQADTLLIGRVPKFGSDLDYSGSVDDFRVYNYSLNQSQIWDIVAADGRRVLPTVDSTGTILDTLVAHYPFNGNFDDYSGFGNGGGNNGAELVEDRFGNSNSAIYFDGTDYIDFGPSEHIEFAKDDFSISLWIKPEIITEHLVYPLIAKGPTEALDGEAFWTVFFQSDFDGVGLSFKDAENENPAFHFGDSKPTVDKWHHVAIVFDRSGLATLYIDNILAMERTMWNNQGYFTNKNEYDLYLGAFGDLEGVDKFVGVIDDLKIFSYALDRDSIASLYHEGGWPFPQAELSDTLVAYYPFNGSAADSSGLGNDGEIFGVSLTEDRFGNPNSAYSFDGFDDYIDIGRDSSLYLSTGFTFSVWAKGVSSEASITGLIASGKGYPYMLGIDDGDRLFLRVAEMNIPTNLFIEGVTTDTASWNHYVGVYKSSEYIKVYKNGEETGSLTESIPMSIDLPDSNLWIGARQNSSNSDKVYYFDGVIDDIRIYSYALSDSVIGELYSEGGWPLNSTSLFVEEDNVPEDFMLYQNYPNPFNPSTTIKFDLAETGLVSLKVFDITGRTVATLLDGTKTAGRYQVNFNASNLASGIYLYELRTEKFSSIKKFTLIK